MFVSVGAGEGRGNPCFALMNRLNQLRRFLNQSECRYNFGFISHIICEPPLSGGLPSAPANLCPARLILCGLIINRHTLNDWIHAHSVASGRATPKFLQRYEIISIVGCCISRNRIFNPAFPTRFPPFSTLFPALCYVVCAQTGQGPRGERLRSPRRPTIFSTETTILSRQEILLSGGMILLSRILPMLWRHKKSRRGMPCGNAQ